jgi:hypothetical protein
MTKKYKKNGWFKEEFDFFGQYLGLKIFNPQWLAYKPGTV